MAWVRLENISKRFRKYFCLMSLCPISMPSCESACAPNCWIFITGSEFTAQVRIVELLGSEQMLNLEVGDRRLTARLDPATTFQIGETRQSSADMNRVHMFDPDTTKAIF